MVLLDTCVPRDGHKFLDILAISVAISHLLKAMSIYA